MAAALRPSFEEALSALETAEELAGLYRAEARKLAASKPKQVYTDLDNSIAGLWATAERLDNVRKVVNAYISLSARRGRRPPSAR